MEIGFLQIEKMLLGKTEFDRTVKLVANFKNGNICSDSLGLRECLAMKHYCELYFLTLSARKLYNDDSLKLTPMNDNENETQKSD